MWVLLTFVFAVGLIYLEFFLPGGILGVLGALSLCTSMGLGFYLYGPATGLMLLVGEIVGAGVVLVVLMRRFPRTKMGRRMILQTELDTASGYVGSAAADAGLAGKTGVAESDLRPAGVIRIGGRRIDAVADGEFVDRGQLIEVMEVEGNRVVVRVRRTASEGDDGHSAADAAS